MRVTGTPQSVLGNKIKEFSEVFGEDRVHVVSYDGVVAAGEDPWDALVGTVMQAPASAWTSAKGQAANVGYSDNWLLTTSAFLRAHMWMTGVEVEFSCVSAAVQETALDQLLPKMCVDASTEAVDAIEAGDRAVIRTLPPSHRYYFEYEQQGAEEPLCDIHLPAMFEHWSVVGPVFQRAIAAATRNCKRPATKGI